MKEQRQYNRGKIVSTNGLELDIHKKKKFKQTLHPSQKSTQNYHKIPTTENLGDLGFGKDSLDKIPKNMIYDVINPDSIKVLLCERHCQENERPIDR